jgi:phospholipase/carboxylesterase
MSTNLLDCVEINPSKPASHVVIWLHGLGADGHDFEAIVPELQLPDTLPIRYVFPHAPIRSVTINYGMQMRAWYDILEMDVSRKVDLDSIASSAAQLEDLIQNELESGFSPQQILLAGFSQGGAIVLHTGLRYSRPLAGILALSTYLPTLDTLEAERNGANTDIAIMLAHGKYDPLIPIAHAIATHKELLRLDYSVQWFQYPMQHEVCMDEIRQIRSWLLDLLE